jgi:hypothetical protein
VVEARLLRLLQQLRHWVTVRQLPLLLLLHRMYLIVVPLLHLLPQLGVVVAVPLLAVLR